MFPVVNRQHRQRITAKQHEAKINAGWRRGDPLNLSLPSICLAREGSRLQTQAHQKRQPQIDAFQAQRFPFWRGRKPNESPRDSFPAPLKQLEAKPVDGSWGTRLSYRRVRSQTPGKGERSHFHSRNRSHFPELHEPKGFWFRRNSSGLVVFGFFLLLFFHVPYIPELWQHRFVVSKLLYVPKRFSVYLQTHFSTSVNPKQRLTRDTQQITREDESLAPPDRPPR